MKINRLPAAAGWHWLRAGTILLRRQPMALCALVVVYLLLMFAPQVLLPTFGVLVAGAINPLASFALLLACHEIASGRVALIGTFAQPLRDPRRRSALLQLGAVNAVLLLVVVAVSTLLAPATPAVSESTNLFDDPPWLAWSIQTALLLPIAALLWFAPALAGWHGMTPGKAMFGSLVASWRNLRPLLVFGFASGALFAVCGLAISALVAAGFPAQMMSLLAAPTVLLLTSIVQASMYPMYRAVFGNGSAAISATQESADQ